MTRSILTLASVCRTWAMISVMIFHKVTNTPHVHRLHAVVGSYIFDPGWMTSHHIRLIEGAGHVWGRSLVGWVWISSLVSAGLDTVQVNGWVFDCSFSWPIAIFDCNCSRHLCQDLTVPGGKSLSVGESGLVKGHGQCDTTCMSSMDCRIFGPSPTKF